MVPAKQVDRCALFRLKLHVQALANPPDLQERIVLLLQGLLKLVHLPEMEGEEEDSAVE